MVDDAELLELVEMEVRASCCRSYEFPGDDTPIIIGSAALALEGDILGDRHAVDRQADGGAGHLHSDAGACDRWRRS